MGRKEKKTRTGPGRLVQWWNGLATERRKEVGRGLLVAVLTAAAVAGTICGLAVLEHRVEAGLCGQVPTTYEVRLMDVPDWMPEALAGQIGYSLGVDSSFQDDKLTFQVMQAAVSNPWISDVTCVTKRRIDAQRGLVEVHAQYRRPVAAVQARDNLRYYVDADGVRLPEAQAPRYMLLDDNGRPARCFLAYGDVPQSGRIAEIHYITIQGVESWPPEPGQAWNGKDIRDGIRLVQLVNTRSYCNQITVVDVRNHDGRISNSEPHLAMYAQVDQSRLTTIKFGRLPMPDGDYVVLPERKLRHMDQYVATHNGRLAGISEWIELRRDDLHFSNY